MIGFLIIGLAAGILSGLFGIGGGILMIPACIWFYEMSQHQAQGTSLGALTLPVLFFAAYRYHTQGYVNVYGSILLGLGLALGAYLSASFIHRVPEIALQRAFGVLLIFIAAQFLFVRGQGDSTWGLIGLLAFIAGAKTARKTKEQ